MKHKNADFGYDHNSSTDMGSLIDDLSSFAMTTVGNKIQTDPVAKANAISSITEVVKAGIMNNKALIITGLIIFGFAMGGSNALITNAFMTNKKG